MEVLLIAGAGIAVAAAVNAANKNNPDRVLAEQEKNALNALKKAQSKRPVNQSEVAQLEANYRSIQIERMRSTMERSEMKMVKYRNEGQIAKAEKHSIRAASLRAELMRTAPHVLSQPANQQFNQPQPYGQAVAAIPIASSVGYQSNDHKGTYAQLPTANQSSSRSNNQSGQGPYTLGDYMGTPAPVQSSANNYSQPWNQQSSQPQSGYPSQSQSGYPSQPQSGYPSQQQPGHQYPGNQRQGAALPEAREVLRTPAVSPLPQFQGSSSNAATNGPASHQSAASQLQGSSTNTASNGAASYQSNNQSANPPGYHPQSNTQSANQPSSYSASQQSNNRNVKNDPPIAREVLRTPDVMPMSQFQSSVASAPGGPALHIDLSHDVPPPSYNPVAAPAAPQQQAYQNIPPPAYVPEDWSMPSKK